MTEQNMTDWLEQEEKEIEQQNEKVFEKLPALKFEENKICEFKIDYSKKWDAYNTENMKKEKVVKVIIPVEHQATKKNWWLNKRNPIYKELIRVGRKRTNDLMPIKVLQTGQQQSTKYILVE